MFRTVLSDQMTGDISKIHFTVKYLMTVDISESVYLITTGDVSKKPFRTFNVCFYLKGQ